MKKTPNNVLLVRTLGIIALAVIITFSMANCGDGGGGGGDDDDDDTPAPPPVSQAGLYAKANPTGNDNPVDLSETAGDDIVTQAVTYVNGNPGTYTLVIDENVECTPRSIP